MRGRDGGSVVALGLVVSLAAACGDAAVGGDAPDGGDGTGGDGGGTDVDAPALGYYMITLHTRQVDGCEGTGEAVVGQRPLLELYRHAEVPHLLYARSCESVGGACELTDDASFGTGLDVVDGGYAMSVFGSLATDPCQLFELASTMTAADDAVHLEIRRRVLELGADEACEPDRAEERAAEMTCVDHRVVDAVKLP